MQGVDHQTNYQYWNNDLTQTVPEVFFYAVTLVNKQGKIARQDEKGWHTEQVNKVGQIIKNYVLLRVRNHPAAIHMVDIGSMQKNAHDDQDAAKRVHVINSHNVLALPIR